MNCELNRKEERRSKRRARKRKQKGNDKKKYNRGEGNTRVKVK